MQGEFNIRGIFLPNGSKFQASRFFTTSTHFSVFVSNSPGILSPFGAFLVPIHHEMFSEKNEISVLSTISLSFSEVIVQQNWFKLSQFIDCDNLTKD